MRLLQLLTPAITILLVWMAIGTNAQEQAATFQLDEMNGQINAVEASCCPPGNSMGVDCQLPQTCNHVCTVNFLHFYEDPCYKMLGADPPDFDRFARLCDLSRPCPRATFQLHGKLYKGTPPLLRLP